MLFFQAIEISSKPIRGYTKDMTLVYYPDMPSWVNVYPLMYLDVIKYDEHDKFFEVVVDITDNDLKNRMSRQNNKNDKSKIYNFLNNFLNNVLHLFKFKL